MGRWGEGRGGAGRGEGGERRGLFGFCGFPQRVETGGLFSNRSSSSSSSSSSQGGFEHSQRSYTHPPQNHPQPNPNTQPHSTGRWVLRRPHQEAGARARIL